MKIKTKTDRENSFLSLCSFTDGPQHEQEQEQEQQLSKCDKLDDKSEIDSVFTVEAAADLYIATHGGCRHHYPCRSVETDDEFDI